MAPEADVARGTRTDATRHARPQGRAVRARAVRRWRTGGRVHEDTRVAPRGRVGDVGYFKDTMICIKLVI